MPLVDDNETKGFSFTWTIQNYSYFSDKRFGTASAIASPAFKLTENDKEKWELHLFTEYSREDGMFLRRIFDTKENIHGELSIRNIRGLYKKLDDTIYNLEPRCIYVYLALLKHELDRKGADPFFDNDSLTLRCRIWKVDGKTLASRRCYARTVIGVERSTHIVNLENLSSEKTIVEEQAISSKMPSLSMKISFSGESYRNFAGDKLQVQIKQTKTYKSCFTTCEMFLLDTNAEDQIAYSVRDEHRFEISNISKIWKPSSLPMSKICNIEKLQFRCEVAVSSGVEYSLVERVEQGKAEYHQALVFDDFLKDDLQRFFSDGKFSDAIIRTTSKDFPVHKAILCARSPVFAAMFERDMKEKRNGVIDVHDVVAEVMSKMLVFLYSDIIEDLDCDMASQLYYAADKYGITALKRRCSEFLKNNLDTSNVCDVLVFADMHQDLYLKSVVQKFVLEHSAEVTGSVEWKKLMKEQIQLASEVMHMVCLRK